MCRIPILPFDYIVKAGQSDRPKIVSRKRRSYAAILRACRPSHNRKSINIRAVLGALPISPALDDYKANNPAGLCCRVSTIRRRTMKYVCLGYYDKDKFDGMAEGERNAMFDTCFEYDDHLRANGHWAGGEALQSQETALTLYWKNGKVATTDGPYAETKEQLGGILVLEARDMNHAVQLMAQHPAMTYGNIFEIRPAGDMNEIMKASEQRRRKDTSR
jgi:hypothetical protein